MKVLVNQKAKYDYEFFACLIEEYEACLYKAAYVYLGSKEEALDAIQETAYRAYKNRRKVKEDSQLKVWLLKILLNYCKDRTRKRKMIFYLKDIELKRILNKGQYFYGDITDCNIIRDVLKKMKCNYKEVMILRYVNSMRIEEISQLLNKSEDTIRIWINRGTAQLRTMVDEEAIRDA